MAPLGTAGGGPALHRIGVVGAGAWGTALALAARRAGRTVRLWSRAPEVVAAINRTHANPPYLPDLPLDADIAATTALDEIADADAVLLVVPAQSLRAVATALAPHVAPGLPVVLCAKGVERGSLKLMSEVLAETMPEAEPAVLSGPSFAADVARGLPTAVTLACRDAALGAALATALGSPALRPYWTADLIGAQIGGAVKNVIAIACGIVIGRGLGESARAAILTRGFAEIARLARAFGAQEQTLTGLSGLGDLALTCTSAQSRNFAYGRRIGAGGVALAASGTVEGVATAEAVQVLARRHGIEMPISAAVDGIVNRGAAVADTVAALLARPLKAEPG